MHPGTSFRTSERLVRKWEHQDKQKCPKPFRIAGIFDYDLDGLNVLGLPALRAFGHFELHSLPFLQAAKAASLDSGEMHEDILSSLAADKAVAFGVVKPLYCSLFQLIFLFPFEFRLRRVAAGEKGLR